MAIRFLCEHCGQRLSVSESNAGRKAKCPKCKATLRVPSVPHDKSAEQSEQPASDSPPREEAASKSEPTAAPTDTPAESANAAAVASPPVEVAEEPGGADGYAQFTVYDEWVFDKGESPDEARDDRPVDLSRVAVPRSVLYMQGVLLGVVALLFFIIGVLVGGAGREGAARDDGPQACLIHGNIAYQMNADRLPDEGAVVVVVPQNARPDPSSKFAAEMLRPGAANEQDPQLLQGIRELGGDFARANDSGDFQLRVPDRGKYFVLVLSRNKVRSANDPLKPAHLAQMGRYFLPADQLVGNNRYEWREETIRRDQSLNVVF